MVFSHLALTIGNALRFGMVEACQYCQRVNIPKTTATMVTCGGYDCKRKQQAHAARVLKDKRRGIAERAAARLIAGSCE
jgi:hypothetical protein